MYFCKVHVQPGTIVLLAFSGASTSGTLLPVLHRRHPYDLRAPTYSPVCPTVPSSCSSCRICYCRSRLIEKLNTRFFPSLPNDFHTYLCIQKSKQHAYDWYTRWVACRMQTTQIPGTPVSNCGSYQIQVLEYRRTAYLYHYFTPVIWQCSLLLYDMTYSDIERRRHHTRSPPFRHFRMFSTNTTVPGSKYAPSTGIQVRQPLGRGTQRAKGMSRQNGFQRTGEKQHVHVSHIQKNVTKSTTA